MSDRSPLIVFVHEESRMLAALESLMAQRDFAVATFTSRGRAMEFIRRSKPDLVFVQEPATKPEGLEFLEQIKQTSSLTEGFFLPSPLDLEMNGIAIRKAQALGILRVIERILLGVTIPDTRRFAILSGDQRTVDA